MKYYHATKTENLDSILEQGIKPGCDGAVYLTITPQDALKFMLIRGITDVIVLEVNLLQSWVEESFDHNQAFFKCRAYCYYGTIPSEKITNILKYDLSVKDDLRK